MALSEELKDPWGWLVAGISGGLGWAVLAAPLGPAAVVAGAAIGAAVFGTKVAIGSARSSQPEIGAGTVSRDRLPEPPRGSLQATLVRRARSAVLRIEDLADSPGDPWVARELAEVVAESRIVLASVAELAGRVTLLEHSVEAASPQLLAQEIESVRAQLERTKDPSVRHEQQRALDALGSQADSVDRLLRGRDLSLARLQTATVGLEGLAVRTGELVALGPASHDTEEANRIVANLTGSLESVRAGVEEARAVLRDL